jgi:hypothetical protein
VHNTQQYWGVDAVSAVAPKEHVDNPRDTAIFDPVSYEPRAPDYNVSQAKFWTLTAKNPNKTVRDYHEKFEHNMPMPVVKDGEVVYSFEGPQIYFNLLNQIIRMEGKVHFDDPDFLKLVVDHVQTFERHWRKMVADIRTGKLDRNLKISAESRLIFESSNIPKPQLATKLDDTFRKLGFHMKVLGKDIEIRPYAQKKKVGIFAQVKPRRKRSLPTNALSTPLPPLSREKSPLGKVTTPGALGTGTQSAEAAAKDLAASLMKPAPKLRFEEGSPAKMGALDRSSSSPQVLKRRAGSMVAPARSGNIMLKSLGESTTTLGQKSDPGDDGFLAPGSAKRRPSRTKREVLAALGQTLQALSANANTDVTIAPTAMVPSTNTATRTGTAEADADSRPATKGLPGVTPLRKRRGSHSEVVARPITSHELDAVHYSIDTAARENYRHTIKTDGDRFVCPFPACGKSFHSMDAAFRHLPVHEQRTRLYAPTPLPDSHLAFYWPEGVPWLEDDKYAARAIPPGALACTVPGCNEVFSAQMQFEAHLRNVHRIVGHSSTSHGYFELVGVATFVPPDRPPPYVPLHWCPLHSLPLGSCTTCVRIDSGKGPKQPFRFYNGIKVNFRLRKALKFNIPSLHHAPQEDEVLLKYSEAQIGVIVSTKQRTATEGPQAGLGAAEAGRGALNRRGSTNAVHRSGSVLGKLRRTDTNLSSHSHNSKTHTGANAGGMVAEWRGRPVAYMTDRNENCWVAVEVLYNFQEALQKGMFVPPGFNKKHQLLRPLRQFVAIDVDGTVDLGELEIYDTAAAVEFERYIRWVPIHMIERTFALSLCITQEEVDEEVRVLPHMALKNRYFVSHDDVE